MKKLAVIITGVILLAGTIAMADVPTTINFQGKLTDSGGNPITATPNITFSIYSASTGSSSIWSETQNSVSVSNGIFSVQLGSVSPIDRTKLPQADLWLGVNVAGDGEMSPRQKLASAPFAIKAASVDSTGLVDDGALSVNVSKLGSTINVSELANGTAGQLITWSASSTPTTVATGTSGQVLTSNGTGNAPTFQDAAAGGGVKAVFSGGGGDLTSNGTNYLSINGNSAVSIYSESRFAVVPISCTAKNLYVSNYHWNSGSAGSHTITLMKGTTGTPSDTLLTCTVSNIGSINTVTTCSDTSNTVSITAGNYLLLKVVSTGINGGTEAGGSAGSSSIAFGFTCE